MLSIKAGAATMAGAWCIHWPVLPVRGLYRPDIAAASSRLIIGIVCSCTAAC